MDIWLTDEEREELKKIHRTVKDGKSRDRIKAILMLDKGYSGREVADVLLLDENTITEWKKRYIGRKNLSDYLFTAYEGYQGKLTAEEEKIVGQYVEDSLITDAKQVRVFIQERFNKAYSKSGVITLLHKLGFRYKQTTLIPSKMDPKKQKAFKEAYDEFLADLKEDEALVFMDGMHPYHNSSTGRAWIKVGQDKEVLSNTGRTRCNLNGAYNPVNQDVLVRNYKTINAETVIEFFKELEDFYRNKAEIYAIVDNARYYKNQMVENYLKRSRIRLLFLPPYSPNLNLIERFWKLLKNSVINNRYYEKFKDFHSAILEFCSRSSDEHRSVIDRFVGKKMHLLKAA